MPYTNPTDILPDLITIDTTPDKQEKLIKSLTIDELFYLVREHGDELKKCNLQQLVDSTLWLNVFKAIPKTWRATELTKEQYEKYSQYLLENNLHFFLDHSRNYAEDKSSFLPTPLHLLANYSTASKLLSQVIHKLALSCQSNASKESKEMKTSKGLLDDIVDLATNDWNKSTLIGLLSRLGFYTPAQEVFDDLLALISPQKMNESVSRWGVALLISLSNPKPYLDLLTEENKIQLFKLLCASANSEWFIKRGIQALTNELGTAKINKILREDPLLTEHLFKRCDKYYPNGLAKTVLEIMTPVTLYQQFDKKWEELLKQEDYTNALATYNCVNYPAGNIQTFFMLSAKVLELIVLEEMLAWQDACRRALFGLYDTGKSLETDEVLGIYAATLILIYDQTGDQALLEQTGNLLNAISDPKAHGAEFEEFILKYTSAIDQRIKLNKSKSSADVAPESESKATADSDFHQQFKLQRANLIACLNDAIALDAKGVKSPLIDRMIDYSCEMLPNKKPDMAKFSLVQDAVLEANQQQKEIRQKSYYPRFMQSMRSNGYTEWVDKMMKVMNEVKPLIMAAPVVKSALRT